MNVPSVYSAKALDFKCIHCKGELALDEINELDKKLNYHFTKGKEWVSFQHSCKRGFIQIALSYMNEYVMIGYGSRTSQNIIQQ